MVPLWSLLPTPWIPVRPFRPQLHASTSSPTAPHLVGHEPLPFFLGLKVKGENVIPEGISKEGSESSLGSPLELLSPYLVCVQLLGDSVDLQPCLLPRLHTLATMFWVLACPNPGACTPACVLCKMLQWPCRSHACLGTGTAAPQWCHSQFTWQPLARSGSGSGISESPAQVLQPQHHPPGPGTRIMEKYLEDTEGWVLMPSGYNTPSTSSPTRGNPALDIVDMRDELGGINKAINKHNIS